MCVYLPAEQGQNQGLVLNALALLGLPDAVAARAVAAAAARLRVLLQAKV
jgi:hypothetical protein